MFTENSCTCSTCIFSSIGIESKIKIPSNSLLCKRYPPNLLLLPDNNNALGVSVNSLFPVVSKNEKCGEYKNSGRNLL